MKYKIGDVVGINFGGRAWCGKIVVVDHRWNRYLIDEIVHPDDLGPAEQFWFRDYQIESVR